MPDSDARSRPRYNEGRAALLAAAVRVVARDGLRGLTYRAVADESRTTHGLVSYHFGSRDRLILDAARHASERAMESAPLGPGGIDVLAAALPRMSTEDAANHTFMFEVTLEARRRPDLMPTVAGLYRQYRALTAAMLAEEGIEDPDGALARAVFAAIDGLTLQHLVDEDAGATEAAIHALRELLRRAGRSGPP